MQKTQGRETTRYELLDLLRGFLLFVVIIDHLTLFPSIFEVITGRGNLWVTAAEGFFFLSGMMVVIARLKKLDTPSLKTARSKLLKRSLKLYGLSVGLTFAFTVIARLAEEYGHYAMKGGLDTTTSTLGIIFKTLTLQYVYGWTDFLAYYAVFILLSIPLSWLIAKKKTLLIALVGLVPWLFVSLYGVTAQWGQWLVWFGYFSIGMVAGVYLKQLQKAGEWTLRRPYVFATLTVIFVCTALLSYGIFMRIEWLISDWLLNHFGSFANRWFGNNRTGILRLPIFILWSAFGALLFAQIKDTLPTGVKNLFLTFGRASLRNYLLQGTIIFLLPFFVVAPDAFLYNSAAGIVIVSLIYYLLRRTWIQRLIPN